MRKTKLTSLPWPGENGPTGTSSAEMHGVVEDGGDNASVAVSGRSCVALREREVADKFAVFLVKRELQVHAIGIVRPAGKTIIPGQLDVAGFVAVDLAGHGGD